MRRTGRGHVAGSVEVSGPSGGELSGERRYATFRRMTSRAWVGLLLMVVACGDDAEPGVDAMVRQPADGEVAVRVIRGGVGAEAGQRVVFQRADSSVIADVATDEDGMARAIVPAENFVTIFDDVRREILTWRNVPPGSEPLYFLQLYFPPAPSECRFELTAPLDPGAASYLFYATAGGQGHGVPIGPGDASTGSPTATGEVVINGNGGVSDILVVSRNADGSPRAAIFESQVFIPDTLGSLDLTGATYTPMTQQIVQLAGFEGPIDGYRELHSRQGGFLMRTEVTAPGAMNIALATPVIPDATQQFDIASTATGGRVLTWGPLTPSTLIDASESLRQGTAPAYDAASRALTWVEAETGLEASQVELRVRTQVGVDFWQWVIRGPHEGTRLPIPVLPATPAIPSPVVGAIESLELQRVPVGYRLSFQAPSALIPATLTPGESGVSLIEVVQ